MVSTSNTERVHLRGEDHESSCAQVESEMPQRHLKGDVKETISGKITFAIDRRLA